MGFQNNKQICTNLQLWEIKAKILINVLHVDNNAELMYVYKQSIFKYYYELYYSSHVF